MTPFTEIILISTLFGQNVTGIMPYSNDVACITGL